MQGTMMNDLFKIMTNNDDGEAVEKTCNYVKLSNTEVEKTKNKCIMCHSKLYDPVKYGDVYQIDGLVVHYFCLLFSSSLIQRGESDDEGLLGFFPKDIRSEARRGGRLRCSYCRKNGATIGCNVKSCKKAFHLPCGLKHGSMHQFFGEFRSFCPAHRPSQSVDPKILNQAAEEEDGLVCPICYETVPNKVSSDTLWAPCCKKRWFHRSCVERQAQAQGYFFKCPMCNNKDEFNKEMKEFGVYIPEMDAAWEREPDAFRELLHRYNKCDAETCKCPDGRNFSQNTGSWRMLRCNSCGSQGTHVVCGGLKISALNNSFRCVLCIEVLAKVDKREDPHPTASTSSSSVRRSGDSISEPQAPKRRKPSTPTPNIDVSIESNSAVVLERNHDESSSPQNDSDQVVLPGPSRPLSNDDEDDIIVVDDSESDVEVIDEKTSKPAPQPLIAKTYPVPQYVDKELFTTDGRTIKVVKVTAGDTVPVENGSLGAVKIQPQEVRQETLSLKVDHPSTSLLPNRQDVSISLVPTPTTPKSNFRKEESSPSNLGIRINNVRHSEELFSPCRTVEQQAGTTSTIQPQFPFLQGDTFTPQNIYLLPVTINGRSAVQPFIPRGNMMNATHPLPRMQNIPPHLQHLSQQQLLVLQQQIGAQLQSQPQGAQLQSGSRDVDVVTLD
ncbi:pineapple eye protein isoform X1 [Frankliniella occidentalis]|uniref:Pineapple eye protein isoform X1 n=2 Tax=Frankliniella occidentalis TaxID=133901 RepID=A0A6J1TPT0_FRAOC|nr:pineapple eye protein isoform X1 [Frankliniella occidentalis]